MKQTTIEKLSNIYSNVQLLEAEYKHAMEDFLDTAFAEQETYTLTEEQIEEVYDNYDFAGYVMCHTRHEDVEIGLVSVTKRGDQYYVRGRQTNSDYDSEEYDDLCCYGGMQDMAGIMDFIQHVVELQSSE